MVLPTKKHWFRFSLASLLILVTAVSLWLGRMSYLANRQREAVAAISAAEGIVIFDDESNSSAKNVPNAAPSSLERLQERIGKDYFRTVRAVDFATNSGRRSGSRQPKATDKILVQLVGVPDVQVLELSHNETVNDESLIHLRGLRNLTTIYLYNTKVRGPGLMHLAALPNLQYLVFSHTPLQDIGLEHLGRMQGLKSLGLAHTKVTDAGVAHLAELKNLETLSLGYTGVTDDSLEVLQRLSKLKELNLMGTKISAEGARKITQSLPACMVLVSFGLGKTATDINLFADGYRPTADEINAKFKALGIDGDVSVDPAQPEKPVTQLYLGETTFSDAAALKLISVMPGLNTITIRRALVGDEFVQGIEHLDNLRYLEMKETCLTDQGLRHLSRLSGLRELVIEQAEITDDGIPFLAGLKQLKMLILRDVRISEDGFERLQQALPNCLYR